MTVQRDLHRTEHQGRPRRRSPLVVLALLLVALVLAAPTTGAATEPPDPRQSLDPAAPVAGALTVLRSDIDVGRDAAPMVVDPDGTAWWLNRRDGSIGRLGTDGTITRLGPTEGVPPVTDLALAPDGAVWFATGGPATVGRIGGGGVTTYLASGHRAIDLDVAADGTVHFISEVGASHGIGRVSPSGNVTAEVLPSTLQPLALSVGHGGDVWFVTPQQIVRRTAGGQQVFTDPSFVWDEDVQGWGSRRLAGIVPGPDGTMRFLLDGWMAYYPQDQLGQVTSDGGVSYLELPTPGMDIRSLHPLPDGRTALLEPCPNSSSTAATCWTQPLRAVDAGGTAIEAAPVSGHPALGPDGTLWLQRGAVLTTIDPAGEHTDRWGNDLETPTALTIGPDGNLWYTTAWGRVGRLAPDGTPLGGFAAGGCCLADIAAGTDGDLWATSTWHGYEMEAWVQRVAPDGATTRTYVTDLGGYSIARTIAASPDGTLWVGTTYGLVRLVPDGEPTAHLDDRSVTDVAAGPDGSAWWTWSDTSGAGEQQGIATMTPEGASTDLEVPGLHEAKDIAAGPDGTVWFTGRATCCGDDDAAIGRITPGGQVTLHGSPTLDGRTVEGIAAGPDGQVWFTTQGRGDDRAGDGIGRITADGTISLVATPGVTRPDRILVAPDGSVWFTSDPQIDIQIGPWNDVSVHWSGSSALGRFVPVPDDQRAPVPDVGEVEPGARSVSVSWTLPDGPVAATGAQVLPVQAGAARPELLTTAAAGVTSATVAGVAPCVATSVRVRSVDVLGPGRWSERSVEVLPTASFHDVAPDHPMGEAIRWLGDRCLSVGYPDGTFRPTAVVTRQALAAQLHRLAGSPPGPFPDPGYVDVPPDHPFRTAVAWMAAEGIAAPGQWFRPTAPVTRQAAAAFLHRAAGSPGPNPPPAFPDVPDGHPFADAVAWMAAEGITTGYADGTFRPDAPLTRQALAAQLHRRDAAVGDGATPGSP